MKHNRLIVTIAVLALIVACLGAFVACGDSSNESDLTKVTFVLDWTPNSNHTGLYVAKELGYFKEAGIDVSFIQPGDTGTSAMIASGVGQFGVDFQEQMIFNEKQNVGVTAIASIVQHNTSGIVSPKDRGIVTPADMAGKKYATWNLPGEQAIVKAMIKAGGKDPAELNMVPNTVKNIIAEFQNPDGVDSVWSYAAWDKIMLDKAGIETNFIWMRDIEGLDYYTPVIIANNDFIKKNPEITRSFLAAASRGYEYAIAHPHEAADLMMQANPELKDSKDLMYASQDFLAGEYKSDAPYWGHIDAKRWDGFFDLMCEIGGDGFPTTITDGYGFTNEYLPTK